ncbi:MAG TPA: carboxypeptidase regulatory-like domain-containing protein, partial [Gemmatimonadaceae bacterium]
MPPSSIHAPTPAHARPRAARYLACVAVAVLATVRTATPALAQAAGVITGTVTAASSREPIGGALVQIEGTRLGTQTAANGTFRIVNVSPGPHTVSARILGRTKASQQVTVTDGGTVNVDFALERAVTTLEAIVTTGTPIESSKRELGNAIGIVNASEISVLAPPPNAQQLLNNVAGVRVASAGGDVGSGGNTRVRGASSMTLSSEPLLYIDGVRVNNSSADNGGFGVGVDSRYPPSRINDINPDEIESIEIVK